MKAFSTFLAAVILTAGAMAQSPIKMSYQAVIRNSSGELVINQPIGMRISILQGSALGMAVYTETQVTATNSIGLVSIEIGGGAGFDAIDWANGPYFIKTETDPDGGMNYTITNTSQLLSVPYALHAKTAKALSGGITETDPVFGASPAKTISGSDIANWNDKQNKLTAGQGIIINGDTISANGFIPNGSVHGEMLYWNGTAWIAVTPGTNGSTLSLCENVPTWGGCVPILTTAPISGINSTTAISGGTITSDRGFPVTVRGICWNASSSPTTDGKHISDGSNTETFTSSLTGLTPNTTYYLRAYASNSEGTAYGNEVSFTTSSTKQVLCFSTTDGIGSSNWSYKDYIIPDGYKIDSLFMDATRPGYPEYQYDLNLAYCPGSSTYNFSVAIFPLNYGKIATSMYNTWINLTNLSIKAAGMVRVKLPTGEGAVWNKLCIAISEITTPLWSCGSPITINHIAGSVAPVTKTVTYGTVTNIPGEPSKCWITQNLGADHQATAMYDTTDASAGWYWQFNRKQGYKHNGTTRTPNTLWVTSIDENSDWYPTNDPCTLELGNGWRIPTSVEWTNIRVSGNWTDWNGPWNSSLKLHAAGRIEGGEGELLYRLGSGLPIGNYSGSDQYDPIFSMALHFNHMYMQTAFSFKAIGYSIRCIRDADF